MLLENPSQFDLEIQQIILNAERVLIDAKSRREAAGLGGADARAQLERQLSPDDVTEVKAAVEAELERIQKNVKSLSAAKGSATAPRTRRARPMV